MDEEKPPFADRSVVGDYRPLLRYIKLAKSRNIDVSGIIVKEDLNELENILETGTVSLDTLINSLSQKVLNRINCELAREVYKDLHGVDYGEEDACRILAKVISGYIIELAKNLGIVKIRFPWRGG